MNLTSHKRAHNSLSLYQRHLCERLVTCYNSAGTIPVTCLGFDMSFFFLVVCERDGAPKKDISKENFLKSIPLEIVKVIVFGRKILVRLAVLWVFIKVTPVCVLLSQ